MGTATDSKEVYEQRMNAYQDEINQILRQEKIVADLSEKDPDGSIYKKIMLIDELLYVVTLYLAKSRLTVLTGNGKIEDILNEARKILYKVIIYLEDIVSNFIDAPFSDYEEKVKKIEYVPQKHRYYLVRKLGLAIDLVIQAYGDNSKWKWAFVEIQGRFATVAKNILDLKDTASTGFDPHSPDYETTMFHLKLVKKLLLQAATKYREKYATVTQSAEDFRLSIQYLSAVHRMHILLNERNEAEEVKKKITIWSAKKKSG